MLDQMLNERNDDEICKAREEEANILKRNDEFIGNVEGTYDEKEKIIGRNDGLGKNAKVVDYQSGEERSGSGDAGTRRSG